MISLEKVKLVLQSKKAEVKIIDSLMKSRKVLSKRRLVQFIGRSWRSLKKGLRFRLWNNKGRFNPEGVSPKIELITDKLSEEESCPKAISNMRDVLGRMTNVPPR